jgi:hypothetical protein
MVRARIAPKDPKMSRAGENNTFHSPSVYYPMVPRWASSSSFKHLCIQKQYHLGNYSVQLIEKYHLERKGTVRARTAPKDPKMSRAGENNTFHSPSIYSPNGPQMGKL